MSGIELASRLEQGRSFLEALVDLRSGGSRYEKATPQQRFEQTLNAAVALLLAESLRQPLILHVEDAIGLDAESRALIRALAQSAQAYPLAQIVTSRYHDDGSPVALEIESGPLTLTLHLPALGIEDVRALAGQVLHSTVGDDLARLLFQRSGGNPFFVEQLALDLCDLDAPDAAQRSAAGGRSDRRPSIPWLQSPADEPGEVPLNITTVLIARIDRLALPLKLVVQAAAVLGQEFDLRVLERVVANTGELAAQLHQIESSMIWDRLTDTQYRFRHALLRNAAYAMQARARLRILHAKAGAAIETIYANTLAPYVADLRHHFREAGDAARECQYVTLLGEQAYNIGAFPEAIDCYERALALVDQHMPSAARRAGLTVLLGRVHAMSGDSAAAERCYTEGLRLAELAGDCASIASTCYDLGALASRRGSANQALDYARQGLVLFQRIGDQDGARRALNLMGGIYIELGEQAEAVACYQQALSLGREALRERAVRS